VSRSELRLEGLSSEQKRALLAQLVKTGSGRAKAAPLSYAQERLWFLDQLAVGNPMYNLSSATRLTMPLNAVAIERTLNEIVRRHEALRTTFQMVNGSPVQVIAPSLQLELGRVDLRALPSARREQEAARLAEEEARTPFQLSVGPLVRTKLVRLAEEDYLFLLTIHHIVSDGWSMNVFSQEFATLYEAYCRDEPSPLHELPIQYADFARWQREYLKGEVLEQQLDYWRKQLRDLPRLELPTDRRRPAVQTHRGAWCPISLCQERTAAVRAFSRREGVTPFMTLLTAFNVFLHRYSGQDDIVVGIPIANRNRAEVEGLIGFFVNTLVLRTRLSGQLTFREALEQVKEVSLGAYTHQDLPFEMLVEKLHPDRDLSRNPLFQVTFQLFSDMATGAARSEPEASLLDVDVGAAMFDIAFSLFEGTEGLTGQWEYSTDVFDKDTIVRMMAHFDTILGAAMENPNRKLAELPVLGSAEFREITVRWNQTDTDFPRHAMLHRLFEQAVERDPEAVAVTDQGVCWNYSELNARADRLAHHLRSAGAHPGARVALCIDRSPELIASVVAVLKTGAAYVPLDPANPPERLRAMLRDCAPVITLTREAAAAFMEGSDKCEPLPGQAEPLNIAYVIYTSGSTGRPRGVEISHAGVVNLVEWHCRTYGVNPADRAALIASPGFDASVWEMWPYLAAGARICIPDASTRAHYRTLLRWLAKESVTFCFLATPLFEAVPADAWPADLKLRALFVGGDRLHRAPPSDLPFRVFNHYGPTENSVVTTSIEVRASVSGEMPPPIGRPIANTRVYVLDGSRRPVPVGVAGELYVGGVGLAQGYLNDPDLTAARFLDDPFNESTGSRMYRTGDLARYRPDGNLLFLGRADDQIKIRGFRVEPGEIEVVLRNHPAVMDAVVVPRQEGGDLRLVAYITPSPDASPNLMTLRNALRAQLPDYMVPRAFVLLDALPLTTNGKVDRSALPAPHYARPESEEHFIAPRDELENSIAAAWQDVLGVERVGIYDNFFDLGGHSLLIVRLHALLQETLHRDIAIMDLFRYPTVSSFAQSFAHPDEASTPLGRAQTRAEKQKLALKRFRPI
jgi:amino acid adenylation domain-containing protein